jgi:hypothetical protein
MTLIGARSRWTAFIVTFGVAAALAGCASLGAMTPVAVTDIKSVAGKWKGVVYRPGIEGDYIELTIREDGSYDFLSRQTVGSSTGRGKMVVSDGRLVIQGEKGRGVATVLKNAGGDRVMKVEATLADNSTLSASLSPSR